MTKWTPAPHSSISHSPIFYDKDLQDNGVDIDNDDFDSNLARTYDVRGLLQLSFAIYNPDDTPFHIELQKYRAHFETLDDIREDDWVVPPVVTALVPVGAHSTNVFNNISPEITAIRMRFKRGTPGQDSHAVGVISVH